jgi:hypothetical protein
MKRSKIFFVALICLFALTCVWGVTPAGANSIPISYITVDEFGNGYGPTGARLPWAMTTETFYYQGDQGTVSVNVSALTYYLPFSVVTSGDVVLTEPGTTSTISDIIRFQGNMLKFYSEGINGIDEPADISFPLDLIELQSNRIFIPEIGPEGNNGAFYYPLQGEPGYIYMQGMSIGYNFISDTPVPLPPTILLLIPGLVGIAGLRRRIKK